MGDVALFGLSHRTSPVEVRERLASSGTELPSLVDELVTRTGASEAVVLSTCNRVEIYVGADDPPAIREGVRQWLAGRAGEPIDGYLYERRGLDAVSHVFRVASSLDSMVVGEPQILGQVKEAYGAAQTAGRLGTLLDRCFTHAFAVAKRVRSETGIAGGSVSVSSVACELAKKIFGDLAGRRVLLVGAGEMGEAAAKHLRKQGANLYIVNRSRERAEALASEHGGQPRQLEELASELTLADVAIASTASPRFVITPELMRGVIKARRHRPLFLIDIAVPRDVDPRVGEMDNIFLYDVDDLEKVASENLGARRREAELAEQIVRSEVENFERWRRSSDLKPTIVAMRARVRATLAAELERTLPKVGPVDEAQRRAFDRMLDAMVAKLVHPAISELKASAGTPEGNAVAEAARRLFALEADEGEPDEPAEAELVPARRSS